jgi:hypothetical protein
MTKESRRRRPLEAEVSDRTLVDISVNPRVLEYEQTVSGIVIETSSTGVSRSERVDSPNW